MVVVFYSLGSLWISQASVTKSVVMSLSSIKNSEYCIFLCSGIVNT